MQEAFEVLHPRSDMPEQLDMEDENDARTIGIIRETVGDFFAEKLVVDGTWARFVVGISSW